MHGQARRERKTFFLLVPVLVLGKNLGSLSLKFSYLLL